MRMTIFGEKYLMLMKNHFCHAKDPPESLIFLSISMLCRHGAPINAFSLNFQLFVKFLEMLFFAKYCILRRKLLPGLALCKRGARTKPFWEVREAIFRPNWNFRENSHFFIKATILWKITYFLVNGLFYANGAPEPLIFPSIFMLCRHGAQEVHFTLKYQWFQ